MQKDGLEEYIIEGSCRVLEASIDRAESIVQ